MDITATRATQDVDLPAPPHEHVWSEIQHITPPSYLVTVHGPDAIAAMDWRYRACTSRDCHAFVYGPDVEHPDVVARAAAAAVCTASAAIA